MARGGGANSDKVNWRFKVMNGKVRRDDFKVRYRCRPRARKS